MNDKAGALVYERRVSRVCDPLAKPVVELATEVRFVEIVIAVNDPAALESLHDWLRGDPDLTSVVTRHVVPPRPGELGGVVDVLVVAAGTGGVLSVLAATLNSWVRRPRHSRITVRLRRGLDGSEEIEIDADRVTAEDVRTVLDGLATGADES